MDILGSTATSNQFVAGNGSSAQESAVAEQRVAEDSSVERREAEPSSTGPGVGERVDIEA
ncbi:hypothetical protein [Kordiimonas sp. SCSIO 12610]|uniref:hypothetical protein n=1 Tax=Kordiimonas sp. SCSIO 12610 TaxID=2829597 RepID=UPI00210B5676|nr:hypothetical protein [Kordiimonas sp. SCSIO 12610]UTW53924.1 hypothetical protein KFF44_08695 [Kordiimonas sp. SCSIO 12610]